MENTYSIGKIKAKAVCSQTICTLHKKQTIFVSTSRRSVCRAAIHVTSVLARAWNLRRNCANNPEPKGLGRGYTKNEERCSTAWPMVAYVLPAFELTPSTSYPSTIYLLAAITGTWLYSSRKRKEEEDKVGRLNASRQPMHANAYLTGLRVISCAILKSLDPRIHG